MTEPLSALLDHYYHDALLQIASSNGLASIEPSGRKLRKDVLIGMLCEQLYVPERARTSLAQLSALQRMALDRILLYGGEVDTYILRDELEREGILHPAPPARTRAGRVWPQATVPNERSTLDRTNLAAGDRPSLAAGEGRATVFEDVIAGLILCGLLLSEGHPQSWIPSAKLDLSPGLRLIVPEPLRKSLPQPALPSVEWGSATLPAPPVETSVSLAQRDLFIYWSHVRNEPLVLTQAGLVQKRMLRAINEQLLSPDPALGTVAKEQESPRLHFLRLLLQGLHLLVRERGRLRAAGPRASVPEFWEKTPEERTSACLQAWTRMADWSELSSLGMSSFDLDLRRARGLLLDQLRPLEPGVWLSADRFLSRLSMTVTHLLFQSRVNRTSAPYYDTDYLTQQSRRLAEVEATFAGGALSGPLHWLGIVDISADDAGPPSPNGWRDSASRTGGESLSQDHHSRLLAFRVNGSAASVLGLRAWRPSAEAPPNAGRSGVAVPPQRDAVRPLVPRPAFSVLRPVFLTGLAGAGRRPNGGVPAPSQRDGVPAESEARVIVQPNFQVFALGPIPEATLVRLEIFADRVKADRSALEYTLSRTAFYRGQQAGLAAAEVITFLEQTSGAALPQNVLRTLQEWGEQHERIVFRRAVSLCEASSAAALDEVWDDPTTHTHLQQRLTPTTALLRKGRLQALREGLLQRGMMPAVSSRTDHCAGQVRATSDGELIPVHDGPNMLLDSCLRRLAEFVPTPPSKRDAVAQSEVPEGACHFQITETAVNHALASGLSVNEYLDQLQAVHHGAVPSALQRRIKAWGRYYGKVFLQQAVLLEVKDAATAAELLADAELTPLLSRFEADPRGRLLLVQTHDLRRLHRLLEERGVEVVQQP